MDVEYTVATDKSHHGADGRFINPWQQSKVACSQLSRVCKALQASQLATEGSKLAGNNAVEFPEVELEEQSQWKDRFQVARCCTMGCYSPCSFCGLARTCKSTR